MSRRLRTHSQSIHQAGKAIMKTPGPRVRIKRAELDYLLGAKFLEPALIRYLSDARWWSETTATLELESDVAERFCDAFTFELARSGFDEIYRLTEEGRMLEDLIDRFTPL